MSLATDQASYSTNSNVKVTVTVLAGIAGAARECHVQVHRREREHGERHGDDRCLRKSDGVAVSER